MNILIVRVSAIGDVIHTLPALLYLKSCLPHARISWAVQTKASAILKPQPQLEHLYVLPDNFLRPKNWLKTYRIIQKLRNTKWDLIIDFQGLLKTSLLYSTLHGEKCGFTALHTREKVSSWFTHHQLTPHYTHIIQKNLALASYAVSLLSPNTQDCPSLNTILNCERLFIPQEEKDSIETWLKKNSLTKTIVLAPNTTWESKHWPLDYWQSFLDLFQSTKELKDFKIVLLGAPFGDQAAELASYAIGKQYTNVVVAPAWNLLAIAHFLSKSNLLIAPDTGLLHLADFIGAKTCGIFGPTLATKHGPFLTDFNVGNTVQIPCFHLYAKKHESIDCMKEFTPQQLIKSTLRAINSCYH